MRVFLAVALALSLDPSHQTSTASLERTPVRVDAIAADARGTIVADLAPADFEVFDDGGTRTVESVRLVRADGSARPGQVLQPILSAADEQVEAAREGTRLFAFFLDEYHVTPGAETARAREAVGRFVDQYLGPRDLVLVVKPLDSLIALRLTRDLETARRAIATFEGRKGELEPRNAFEKNYIGASPARIEAVREQIVTSALNALATHLAGLGASRKTLVVVSEGFSQAQRRRGDESLPTLEGVIRSANRGGASIYAIDPRGLVAPPRSAGDVGQDTGGQDALLALSNETGGRAILRSADLADELSRIARDASSYYLITFQSEREADGRFHPLDVRVRRAGVQLRVRKGYWSALADSVWRSRLSTSAEAVRPPELPRRTSPLIRPWFGLSRGDAGKTRVSFVWEPAARVPGDRTRTLTPVRITLKASKPDGTLVFEGAVRPTGPFTSAGPGDEPPQAVFEAAPGRLRVQMSIEDAASRVVDTDVRDVVVGPLSGPLVLGTAEVLRAGNARAYRALEADATAAPVAARVFSRTERLLIRVPVYAADQSALLTASLASKPGTSMRALAVTRSSRRDVYEVDLPLAGLAAGDYVVGLTAKSPAGDANDVVAFRVTP
jgi:VWFA-related protein